VYFWKVIFEVLSYVIFFYLLLISPVTFKFTIEPHPSKETQCLVRTQTSKTIDIHKNNWD